MREWLTTLRGRWPGDADARMRVRASLCALDGGTPTRSTDTHTRITRMPPHRRPIFLLFGDSLTQWGHDPQTGEKAG